MESGINGVTIHLFDANGQEVATTTTDMNGFYQFTGLAAGSYTITEDQPSGFTDGTTTLAAWGETLAMIGSTPSRSWRVRAA